MSQRELYKVPPLVDAMMERGWLGEKTGSGFYKRVKGAGGESEILTLDWQKMEYRPRQKRNSVRSRPAKALRARASDCRCWIVPALEGKGGDKANQFLWATLGETCVYAARPIPEIANSVVDVDRAMRWGFAWELGPFEIWDAIGVERMAKALEREEKQMPELVRKVLASPKKTFYEEAKGRTSFS